MRGTGLSHSHGLESPINPLVFVICKRQKNHTNYRCMSSEFTSDRSNERLNGGDREKSFCFTRKLLRSLHLHRTGKSTPITTPSLGWFAVFTKMETSLRFSVKQFSYLWTFKEKAAFARNCCTMKKQTFVVLYSFTRSFTEHPLESFVVFTKMKTSLRFGANQVFYLWAFKGKAAFAIAVL